MLPPGTVAGRRQPGPKRELRAAIAAGGRAALDDGERLGSRQRSVLVALSGASGELAVSELAARCGSDRATLRRLEARGLVELREVEVRRRPATISVGAPARPVELNRAQRHAVDGDRRGP